MAAGDWKEMLIAAENGDLELVRYHIKHGEDPNYQHPEFLTTPLIESAQRGHVEVVKFLLEHGANPQIKSEFGGETPLDVAKAYKRPKVVSLLKKYLI